MPDWLLDLLWCIALVAIGIYGLWRYSRQKTILRGWAKTQKLRLVEAEVRYLLQGPFSFGDVRPVYRITAETPAGDVKRGWVRCGGLWVGMFSDQVDVRWDVEAPHRPGFPVVIVDRKDPPDDSDRPNPNHPRD